MTLKNAFGDLSLEATQVDIENAVTEMMVLLGQILTRTGYFDPTTGGQRVSVANTPAVTISSGTVSTVSNQTQMSGYSTIYDQYSAMQQTVSQLRQGITVS